MEADDGDWEEIQRLSLRLTVMEASPFSYPRNNHILRTKRDDLKAEYDLNQLNLLRIQNKLDRIQMLQEQQSHHLDRIHGTLDETRRLREVLYDLRRRYRVLP